MAFSIKLSRAWISEFFAAVPVEPPVNWDELDASDRVNAVFPNALAWNGKKFRKNALIILC